jgi:hypothetical protein
MSWRLGMSNVRPGANVVDEHVFMFVLELEIRKALRLQYPISLVTISAHESAASTSAGLSDADLVLRVVSRSIRGADLIGLVPNRPMALRALLSGAYIDDVGPVMERIRNDVPRELRLRFGVACFPGTDISGPDLLARADTEAGLVAAE